MRIWLRPVRGSRGKLPHERRHEETMIFALILGSCFELSSNSFTFISRCVSWCARERKAWNHYLPLRSYAFSSVCLLLFISFSFECSTCEILSAFPNNDRGVSNKIPEIFAHHEILIWISTAAATEKKVETFFCAKEVNELWIINIC